jgi:ADP-ribose pyrophosphatase YjhB (NUDIX family)
VLATDLTVAAVVERDGKFLIVEERSSGVDVITQPGGHIETGESPEEACTREVLEETGCDIAIDGLLGVYLWIHPQTRQQFLRIVYVADLLLEDPTRKLDHGIHAVHWYNRADIEHHVRKLRTPVVLRSVDDFLAGKRQPESILAGAMPIQQRVADVLASASLV